MKSYNHLYEQLLDENVFNQGFAEVMMAHDELKYRERVNRYRRTKQHVKERIFKMIRKLADKVEDVFPTHTPVTVRDGVKGKLRRIVVPTFDEQIIHHMVVIVMQEIFTKGMYRHSYGSVPSRGPYRAKRTIEKFIKRHDKHMKYYVQMDIKKFFDSIQHRILKKKLSKKIHDDRFLNVLFAIIDVDGTNVGLPLGFYTSQWLANWFLQDLDHFIKERLHIKYYVRYMDDMVIFGNNKKTLHQARQYIEVYLNNKLGLEMKKNWQLSLFHYIGKNGKERGADLDYIGFRFFRNRTILRKVLFMKISRKAKHISKGHYNIYNMRQFISYYGYIKHTNTYNVYMEKICTNFSFKRARKYISRYDKIQKQNRIRREMLLCG